MSFFWPRTYGFTNCGDVSFTPGQTSQLLGPNNGLLVLLPSQPYIVGCFRRDRSAVPVAAVSSEQLCPAYLLRAPAAAICRRGTRVRGFPFGGHHQSTASTYRC